MESNDEWQRKQLTNTFWFLYEISVGVRPCDEVLFSSSYVNDIPPPNLCHPRMTLISKFKAATVRLPVLKILQAAASTHQSNLQR